MKEEAVEFAEGGRVRLNVETPAGEAEDVGFLSTRGPLVSPEGFVMITMNALGDSKGGEEIEESEDGHEAGIGVFGLWKFPATRGFSALRCFRVRRLRRGRRSGRISRQGILGSSRWRPWPGRSIVGEPR